jgi:hypothetical protein
MRRFAYVSQVKVLHGTRSFQRASSLTRRVTIDRKHKLPVEIDLNKTRIDDIPKRFEGTNKREIKTTGIHPGWRDDS